MDEAARLRAEINIHRPERHYYETYGQEFTNL